MASKIVQVIFCMGMLLNGQYIFAQNDVQLSQQLFSRINYNPAATGLSEDLNFYLLARQQWVGFKNAPQTIVLNGSTFVPWTRSGWGFSVVGDMLGHQQSVNPKITYAYHIPFMRSKSSLSLGLSAGVLYKTTDGASLVYENPTDPNRLYQVESGVKPDFDFGLEYNSKHISVGTSVTHLGNAFDNKIDESSPHFYAYARGMIDLSQKWQLTPAFSWHNSKTVQQFEANAIVFYKKVFWVGASYRVEESIVALLGAYITPNIMLGYSYDYNAGNNLSAYSQGSHEIMLSVRIPQPQKTRKASRMRECTHEWW